MLVLALFALAAAQKAGQENVMCFDDGIPAGDRRFLDGPAGDLPFGLVTYGRMLEHPNAFFSDVMLILMREKLGVHAYNADQLDADGTAITDGTVSGINSNQGLRTIAGCTTIGDAACNDRDASYRGEFGHLFIGYWKSYGGAAVALEASPRFTTTVLGGHGYDGMFVKEKSIDRADVDGLDLRWAGNYNVAGTKAKQYFQNSLADLAHLNPVNCTPLTYMQDSYVSVYKTVSGDADGGPEACEDNWWISAGCRDDKTNCIPIITSGDGWSIPMFMQYSYFYGVPLAIGTLDWGEYVSAGQNDDVMLYWWYPDMTFARDLPMRVHGMPANTGEQAKGIWSTANEYDTLMNALYEPLQEIDPKAWGLSNNLYLDDFDMQKAIDLYIEVDILRHSDTGGGGNADLLPERYELACRWLKENEERWANWVPDKTDCRDTEGVIFQGENAMCVACTGDVVSVIGLDGYRICDLCPAGTVQIDGVCEPCPMGRFNVEVGAEACAACPRGHRGKDRGADTASAVSAATGCEPCPDGTYAFNEGSAHCSPCPGGKQPAGIGQQECASCPAGTFSQMKPDGMNTCEPCPIGHKCGPNTQDPLACSPGEYNDEEAQDDCKTCPAGEFSGLANATSCAVCGPGTSAEAGATECLPCAEGYFTAEAGSSACAPCAQGTFAVGLESTECRACEPGSTRLLGATAASDCQCEEGTFLVAATETCATCQEGLYCPGDNLPPLVQPGFYAEWSESSITVFRCAFGELSCPGAAVPDWRLEGAFKRSGVPELRFMEVCAAGSGLQTVNGCTRCEDGWYYAAGECVQCKGEGAYYPLFFIAMVAVVLGVYKVTSNPKSQQVSAAMMLACLGGITVSVAQTLAIYSQFTLEFPVGMQALLKFLRLFLFDAEVLNVTCALGSSLAERWGARMFSPFIFLAVVASIYFGSRALEGVTGRNCALHKDKLINAVGLMTNAVYITLCKLSMQLMECRAHPSAPSTVSVYPDIKCSDEARHTLLPLNVIIILLLPVGIYVLFCYVCYVAPSKWSGTFQARSKFLLRRWKPTLWWFGPVCMMRNLLLALVCVVFPSSPLGQLSAMCTLLMTYAGIQSSMQPWRADSLNKTDAFLNGVIGLLCMFSMALVPAALESEDRRGSFAPVVLTLTAVAFSTLALAVVSAVGFALRFEKERQRQLAHADEAARALEFVAARVTSAVACCNERTHFVDSIAMAFTGSELNACMNMSNLVLSEVFNENLVSGGASSYNSRLTAREDSKDAIRIAARCTTQPDAMSTDV